MKMNRSRKERRMRRTSTLETSFSVGLVSTSRTDLEEALMEASWLSAAKFAGWASPVVRSYLRLHKLLNALS